MANSQQFPESFMALCQAVTAKRPKAVINHILQHGFVTTEDLKTIYGYNHPPRAARDVREHGIPLETFRVTGSDGRKIAAYRFGDVAKARFLRLSGRTEQYQGQIHLPVLLLGISRKLHPSGNAAGQTN